MENSNVKKILLILLLVLSNIFMQSAAINIPVYADEKNDESVSMNVTYGIEGLFRGETYIPINIAIENNSENISGKVEVRIPSSTREEYDAFVKEVDLQSGDKTNVIIPIIMPDEQSKFSVILYNGEDIIKKENSVISTGRLGELDMFIGNLTEDFNGITFKDIEFKGYEYEKAKINKSINIQLDEELFNENESCLSALDVILINNYDLSTWTNEEFENLNEWVNNGGTLILGSGENAAKTIGNIKNSFLDINYEGTYDINNYTLANLSIKDGALRLGTQENPLIYSVDKGNGQVYIASFDLSNSAIASSSEVNEFWKNTLGNRFLSNIERMRNYLRGYDPYSVESLISNVPLDEEFNFKGLVILFISYTLICGILIYFIMKKLNKREYLWVVIPVIAVVFSIILYAMGSSTRVNDMILNQVNVIDIDKDGNNTIKGYVGIGSKYKTNLLIKKPSNAEMEKFEERAYRTYDNNSMTKLRDKRVYKGNDSYYEFNDLSALSLKKFVLKNHNEIVPALESEFKFDSETLIGKVKNNNGYDIEKLVLVSGVHVWDLGKVKGNEEITIEEKKYSSQGINGYSNALMEDYWNNFRDNHNKNEADKEKYKNIMRISDILSSISRGRYTNNSTYLVAINNMPMEYGFDFDGKSISKYDTSIIIQESEIEFRDKDNNFNYPLGHYQGVERESNELHIGPYNNEIYGTGEGFIDYKIDDLDVISLKVGYIENPYNNVSFNGKIYIYNFTTKSFDEIKYSKSSIEIKNPADYISNGLITIKVEGDNENGAAIPAIAVKGREKNNADN